MAGYQDLLPQAEEALRAINSHVTGDELTASLLRSLALSNIQLVTEMRVFQDEVRQLREALEIQGAGGLGGNLNNG